MNKVNNLSALKALLCLCLALPVFAQAEDYSRLRDPLALPAYGSGWSVEPRQGQLGMTFTVGVVPGPLPIPVAFRLSGSFSRASHSYNYVSEVPVGRRMVPKKKRVTFTSCRGVHGLIHFGYISPRLAFKDADDFNNPIDVQIEAAVYVLEDGTVFRPSDLRPFTAFNPTFTLPPDFGLGTKAPGDVQVNDTGSLATYVASPADLGTWRGLVEASLPVGFGPVASYTVVMDKDRARVFASLPALGTAVPLLWLDRFAHTVVFSWTRVTTGLPAGLMAVTAVEARNHLGKGVQVQWADYDPVSSPQQEGIQDLAKVAFLGMEAPSALIQGYPGLSPLAPAGAPGADGAPLSRGTPRAAGWMGRPTVLRLGSSLEVGQPGWLGFGRALPVPPGDGTLPAPSMAWSWEYDAPHAEVAAFTDAAGVRTAFTYVNPPGEFRRAVTQAISTDALLGITRSRNWTWGTTATGDPSVILKDTFGPLDTAARTTELDYVASATSAVQYGDGACHRVAITGADGTTSTTLLSLGTVGLKPYYSSPLQTDIARSGEPPVTRIVTTDVLGVQTLTEETRVNGVRTHLVANTYDPRRDKLDCARQVSTTVTRYDPASGAALPETSTRTWSYDDRGLPTEEARTGASAGASASEGTCQTFDPEGRLTGTRPSGAAPWIREQAWQTGTWGVASVTTRYQNPGDGPGVFSGALTQTVQARDAAGRPTRTMDARAVATTTTYDLFGRVCAVQTDGEGPVTTTYAPDLRSRTVTQVTGPGATAWTRETLDGFGRIVRRDFSDGRAQTFAFDDLGRPASTRNLSATGTPQPASTLAYDALDRPVTVTTATGAVTALAYAASGSSAVTTRTTAISDGISTQNLVVKEYRQGPGVVRQEAADGTVTETVFNGLGQVASATRTPAGGGPAQVRSFAYDPLGRLLQKTAPETGTQTYGQFDALGNPGTLREASGRTRTFTRDGLGRPRVVTSSSGAERLAFTYAGADLVASSTVSDGATLAQAFEYGGPGHRLSRETTTQPGLTSVVQYAYDPCGRLASLTYPSGRVVGYTYDAQGRITGITHNGASLVSRVGFNAWNQRQELAFASGAFSRWEVNDPGTQVTAWTIGAGGAVLSDGRRTYAYDTGGRLTRAGEWSLVHDPLGRILQANFQPLAAGDPAFSTFHGYDTFGNAISHTAAGTPPASLNTFDLAPQPGNRMAGTARNGSVLTGWVYDADGEATSLGTATGAAQALTLAWDGLGRLAAASAPGTTQYYAYTPGGLRASMRDAATPANSRSFAYTSGGLLLGEYAGAWKRDVIYLGSEAIAEVDASGTHELHSDHLGTPRVITSGATGQVEGRQAIGPYGEAMPGVGAYVPLTGFTGHAQADATGLIYMRGRYYSPAWHRFVNSDQGADAGQMNEYAYCGGDPLGATDPSGLRRILDDDGRWHSVGGGHFYGLLIGVEATSASGNAFAEAWVAIHQAWANHTSPPGQLGSTSRSGGNRYEWKWVKGGRYLESLRAGLNVIVPGQVGGFGWDVARSPQTSQSDPTWVYWTSRSIEMTGPQRALNGFQHSELVFVNKSGTYKVQSGPDANGMNVASLTDGPGDASTLVAVGILPSNITRGDISAWTTMWNMNNHRYFPADGNCNTFATYMWGMMGFSPVNLGLKYPH